jgi:AmiR/NasT family two-component response regulator
MERFRVTEDDAFNLLRSQARDQRRKISELAQDIVSAAEKINLAPFRKPE